MSGMRGICVKHIPISGWLILAYPVILALAFRRRDFSDYTVIDTAALCQIGYVCVAGLVAIDALCRRGKDILNLAKTSPLVYVFLYLLWALVSTVWSIYPALTAYRAIEVMVFLALLADINTVLKANKSQALLVFFCVIASLADLIVGLRSRVLLEMSQQLPHQILMLHSNVGSAVACFGFFLSLSIGTLRFRQLISGFFLLFVLITTSSATYISFALGIVAVMLYRRTKRAKLQGLLVVLTVFLVVLAVGAGRTASVFFFKKNVHEIVTATGRLDRWQWRLGNQVIQHSLLGQGFDVGEKVIEDEMTSPHAHNCFMTAVTTIGIPGVLLMFALMTSGVLHCRRLALYDGNPWPLGGIIAVWTNMMTTPSVASRLNIIWIVVVWLTVILCSRKSSDKSWRRL